MAIHGKKRLKKSINTRKELNDFYAAVRGFEFSVSELDKYTWTISQSSKNTSEKFYWIPANKFPGMSKD